MKTNWKTLISQEMIQYNESFENIIACTLPEQDLLRTFENGYGVEEGSPFTLWTERRVYFPCAYDGSEWVESVSRNPDNKPTEHVGGG